MKVHSRGNSLWVRTMASRALVIVALLMTPPQAGQATAASPMDGRPSSRASEILRARENAVPASSVDEAGWTWEWLGPGNIGGRVRAIVIHPQDPNRIWIASPVGGIWRSTGTGHWEAVDDFLPSLAVSTLIVHPVFDRLMYAGTGEGLMPTLPRLDGSPGVGIYKSIDGGETWQHLPSTVSWADDARRFVNRLAVHPDNPDIVIAATDDGIWRTTSGGDQWTKAAGSPRAVDVKFDPDNPNFVLVGAMGACYYSLNAGASWSPSSFGQATQGRVEIAFGSSGIVYACMGVNSNDNNNVRDTRLYKSLDSGRTFSLVSSPNFIGRPSYNNTIWVAPDNPDLVVVGGENLNRSTNGGVTFRPIAYNAYVLPDSGSRAPHGDYHAIVAHPFYGPTNRTVYVGNDGGISRTANITDPDLEICCPPVGGLWENLNRNLGITQFFSGAATAAQGIEWFLGGGQDNGRPHLRVDGASTPQVNSWRKPFFRSGDDIYQVAIDGSDPDNPVFYAAQVLPIRPGVDGGLKIWKGTDQGDSWCVVWQPCPFQEDCLPRPLGGEETADCPQCDSCTQGPYFEGGRRLAPLLVDQSSPNILLAGAQRVWQTNDAGEDWYPITGFESFPGPSVSAIDIAPSDPETYWVGYENGVVTRTHNGRDCLQTPPGGECNAATWTYRGTGQLPEGVITDIAINPSNRAEVFLTFEFEGARVSSVWYTDDDGASWEERSGTPPFDLPDIRIHSIRVHPLSGDRVYAGTDRGVYASSDRGLTWTAQSPANVEVWELSWQGSDYLVAATNGRGMFRVKPPYLDFSDVSALSNTNDSGLGRGVAWGDYDNDGDEDLYLVNTGSSSRLFANNGDGTFTDVTADKHIGDTGAGEGAAWADYDNDGDLDLYLAKDGQANRLFQNGGAPLYVFSDVTAGPLGNSAAGRSVAWGDYDQDGDVDLYVVNWSGGSRLLRNEGPPSYEFVDASVLPIGDLGRGEGAAWADYDNDGDPDLYLSRSSGQADKLFRNEGASFVDVTAAMGLASTTGSGLGVAWGDYDNDGDLDLYVVNSGTANQLFRNEGGVGFTDVAAASGTGDVGVGRGCAWGDYNNDGNLDLYVSNSGAANVLYRSMGGGVFTDATTASGTGDAGAGRGVAWCDHDGDGDLDLYVANFGQENKLYCNDIGSLKHWLGVKLVGVLSNRSGIGARVTVVAGGVRRVQEVSGGSGYLSQNSLPIEFGLGLSSTIDSLIVKWPSGVTQVQTSVPADQRLTITEPGAVSTSPVEAPPLVFALHEGSPNPFQQSTTISYDLPGRSRVELRIYDVAGRLVRVLENTVREPGRHRVIWNGLRDSGARAGVGLYFCQLQAEGLRETKRLVLLK